ncbi:M10 family metallopeptidase [Methylosoma difficile]
MATATLSGTQTIDALMSLYKWSTPAGTTTTITFSFPTATSTWISGYGPEISSGVWSPLNATQQANFISALATWSDVANINFTQVADNASVTGSIRAAFSTYVDPDAGLAYYPVSSSAKSGDIWFNPKYTDYAPGGQLFQIMQHEIGHALGLKHINKTISGNPTYLTGAEDNKQYSTMSYNEYTGAGNFSTFYVQPSTPMLYDIAAIQYLYGANMTTRTGNDTYTFSNTKGELKTIWDAGGIDTFDLSNQTFSQIINLNAGTFSSLGVKQTPTSVPTASAVSNVAIAYNVSIENAIGGSGNDTLIGNDLNNTLTGGSGNDNISGNLGNDKLDGGLGDDSMSGGGGNDTYIVNSTGDTVTEAAASGSDTVQSSITYTLGSYFEKLTLTGSAAINGTGNGVANTITGNSAANTLSGNAGNDKLVGGAGADTLIGGAGNDTLTGGIGQDTFIFDSVSGIDTVTDFSVVDDTIQLKNTVFTALTVKGGLAAGQLVLGSQALDTNDYIVYNQSTGKLYYDADGSGAGSQVQIATLGVNLTMTNADFVVV